MPEAVSHHLLEPDIFFLVEADGQPRPARFRTVYEDGTEGETIHVLYWQNNPKELPPGGEVRSALKEDYPAVQPLPS